ncbi:MAG: hypothetical protein U5N26_00625 [Candidatus Marinimicrobia bacterium]|nr:hypothetical protein [Candidatus Neomarinimicrobiota bacterium]
MKRYASVDFMRGLAIALMLVLHMVMHTLNVDAITEDFSGVKFIEFILMIVLPFCGGLAGFFLMVSAAGNAISMENALQRNISPSSLARRQVLGGFILLCFAMLVEGLIGYHGDLGVFVHESLKAASDPDLGPVRWNWDHSLWRFNHFETIHTIAWCIIINGIIHSILVSREKYRDKRKLIRAYVGLAVIVLLLTPAVWGAVHCIIPGYPAQEGTYLASYPRIGENPFGYFLLVFFLQPLAGHPEPLFPYLAVSFIGTIFGIFLTMPESRRRGKAFINTVLRSGMIAYFIGLAGVIANIFLVVRQAGFDKGLDLYIHIWDHRGWTPDLLGTPLAGWFFQFLLLSGFSTLLVAAMIRLVEMRGRAKAFGDKTRFVRRFGFVAFTNYTIQYLYFIAMFISLDLVFGIPYGRRAGLWGPTVLTIIIGMGMFALLLYLWEKIRYAGSLEWMVKQCNYFFNPVRSRRLKAMGVKWYQAGLLNVQSSFYRPEWVNVRTEDAIDHEHAEESRLAFKLGIAGFVFPPFAFAGYLIARRAAKSEGGSCEHRRALRLTALSVVVFLVWVLLFCFLSPSGFA